MARKFKVEIVTPEKILFSEEVESLVVPAERGYLGVLAGHAPLLCALRAGEIRMIQDGNERWFATSGGFMEVAGNKASLLVESAEPVEEIDLARAEESLRRARERLASADKHVDRERAQASLERARNRVQTASNRKAK
jgi:F-type H+-transporting ATPase subunit epsilon